LLYLLPFKQKKSVNGTYEIAFYNQKLKGLFLSLGGNEYFFLFLKADSQAVIK